MPHKRSFASAFGIAALYCGVSLLWIYFSDQAVGLITTDPATIQQIQTYKGFGFVAATTLILFALVRAGERRSDRLFERLVRRSQIQGLVGEIHRNLNFGQDEARVMQGLCERAAAMPGIQGARVCALLPASEGGEPALQVLAQVGTAAADPVLPPGAQRGALDKSLMTGKPVVIGGQAGSEAVLYVPVVAEGPASHVLALDLADAGWHRPEHRKAFQQVGEELARGLAQIRQRRAQAELEQARALEQQQLRLIIDSADALIAYVGKDLRYRFTNNKYEDWLHVGSPGQDRRQVREVVGEATFQAMRPKLERVLAGEAVSYDLPSMQLADGSIRSFLARYAPVVGEAGQVEGFVAVINDVTEARNTAKIQQEAEARFRGYVEHCPVGILVGEASGCIADFNPAMLQMLGYGADELRGVPARDIRIEAERAQADEDLAALVATGHFEGVRQLQRKDGSSLWARVRGTALPDGRLIAFIQDITGEQASFQALRDSEMRWQFALEGSDQGVWDWHIPSGQVFFSPRWKAMLGFAEDEVGNTRGEWERRVLPEDLPEVEANIQRHLRQETPAYENVHRMRTKDGSLCWILDRGKVVEWSPTGQPLRMIGTHTDITRLRALREALLESEARARLILDCAPEGMMLVDAEGRILQANRRVAEIFGRDPLRVIGSGVEELLPDPLREAHAAHRAFFALSPHPRLMAQGEPLTGKRNDGTLFPVKVALAPVQVDGQPMTIASVIDISQQHAADLALQRYADIVNIASDGLVFTDMEECYALVNPAFCALYGISSEDILGRKVIEVIGPEAYREIGPRLARAREGEACHFRSTRRLPDGRSTVVDAEYRPFIRDGEIKGVVAWLRDVTETIKAEAALEATRGALERAQAIAKVGTWTTDFETRTAECSGEARRILGLSDGVVPWETYLQMLFPDDRSKLRAAWRAAALIGQLDVEIRINRDGNLHWLRMTAECESADGKRVRRATGMVQDITEIRAAQIALENYRDNLQELVAERTAELDETEQRLRLIFDSTADGLFGVNQRGQVIFTNPAACRMLGFTAHQLLGTEAHRTFHHSQPDGSPYPREACPLAQVLATGQSQRNVQETFWRADGTPLPVVYSVQPMRQEGAIVGAVVSFFDYSAQVAAEEAREEALQEAQRLAQARSAFVANMSHEIRTPLNAVLGFAQTGLRRSTDPGQQETLRRILDAGQILVGVVNDVLDFSKIEAGKLVLERVTVDLGELIDRVVTLSAQRAWVRQLELQVREAREAPARFIGDPLRLAQVLINLLSNAIKFTEEGRVTLEVHSEDRDLVICITDTGIGIDPATQARLFSPFEQGDDSTTRRFGGTGLGLAITQRLVTCMGGTLTLRSIPEVGSTFEVRLPIRGEGSLRLVMPQARVGLAGFDLATEAEVAAQFEAEGLHVFTLAEGQAGAADLVLMPLAAAFDGTLAALAGAPRLAVVLPPGKHAEELYATHPELGALEWPLRTRHVYGLLLDEPRPVPEMLQPGPRLAGLSILAAEDNEVNRLVLQELLEMEGARLVCAESGSQAIEILEAEGPEAFDLVLTDIQMPGMDGYATTRRVQALAPELPVIGLTAFAQKEDRDRCLAAGMAEHLAKPIEHERMVATVLRVAGYRLAQHQAVPPEPPAPEPAPAPALRVEPDWEALYQRFPNKEAFIQRLVRSFLNSYAEAPATLRRLAAQGGEASRTEIGFLAHALKGSSGNLAVAELQALAFTTMEAARGQSEELLSLALQLADVLAAALQAMEAHLEPAPANNPDS